MRGSVTRIYQSTHNYIPGDLNIHPKFPRYERPQSGLCVQ